MCRRDWWEEGGRRKRGRGGVGIGGVTVVGGAVGHFVVLGDSGGGSAGQQEAIAIMKSSIYLLVIVRVELTFCVSQENPLLWRRRVPTTTSFSSLLLRERGGRKAIGTWWSFWSWPGLGGVAQGFSFRALPRSGNSWDFDGNFRVWFLGRDCRSLGGSCPFLPTPSNGV